jgi:O-antigen/teichoic acid export membrane protein
MTTAPVPTPATLPEIRDAAPPIRPIFTATDFLTSSKLRIWGRRSALSLMDQGLTSLTGFSVSFLLARWLAPESYGAYAIAFAAYLFVCGFHNVIILEPMSVLGPARHSKALLGYFRAQISVHGVLVGALSMIAALAAAVTWRIVPQSPLAGAIVGSAIALPFLLLIWLARRMCYILQRPGIAILGSATCLATVLVGLYMLRHLNALGPFYAFLLVGAGSLLGSALVLGRIKNIVMQAREQVRIPWGGILRENFSYGRWLIGSTVLYSISGQVQMFLAAAFLGLGSAGVLRAMMLPAAVMTQAVSATDLLIVPGFSYDFGRGSLKRMRVKAMLVSCALGAAGLIVAAMLRILAGPAEHLFFGGKFSDYIWLMPLLALVPAANGFNSGFSAALRGSQKPHFDLVANALAAPIAILSAVFFIRWWGLAGAGISMVMGFVVYMAVNAWFFFTRHESSSTTEESDVRRS